MSTTDGRLYRTARWARCREIQLSREPMCEGCETRAAEHVDHIVPVKAGGAFWQSSNWQSLCPSCHSEKTACDRIGRPWLPARHRGVDEHGIPRDPAHPWHRGAFDHHIGPPRTDAPSPNRNSQEC